MIEIRDLTLGYPKSPPVLKDFSLCIKTGEVVSILGPNGCGKTTLLKAILRFLPVPSGHLLKTDDPMAQAGTAI